jgi:hypothetical protein
VEIQHRFASAGVQGTDLQIPESTLLHLPHVGLSPWTYRWKVTSRCRPGKYGVVISSISSAAAANPVAEFAVPASG